MEYVFTMGIYLLRVEEAWSWTESDIVVHTRYGSTSRIGHFEFFGMSIGSESHLTAPNPKNPLELFYTFIDIRSLRIWTEVESSILGFLSSFYDFWNWSGSDFYIGKVFIILHEDIIFWREMLDEIGLEDERLYL